MATKRTGNTFRPPDEVFTHLAKGPVCPLYLFHGDETYFINRAVSCVHKTLGQDVAVDTFYAGEDSLDYLLEAWGSPSLFAKQTLVVLKGAERLTAVDRERLAAEAELRDASQPLVVCCRGRANLSLKFFSVCAKHGFVAEFRPLFVNLIPGWVHRFARERGVRLNTAAASDLADHIGTDLLALSTEMDKLVAFVFPETEIGVEAVRQCAGDLHQHSAFDLADALGQRNGKRAFGLLRQVLSDEKQALPVLHALAGHFRRLWQVKDLRDSKAADCEVERAVGLRGKKVRAMVGQSRAFSYMDLQRVLHQASCLDIALKSSRTPPQVLFDAFILEVCGRAGTK